MKIGILYIGIGRYICFWKDFYDSCEKFLIPEAEKHYYVFTDNESLSNHRNGLAYFIKMIWGGLATPYSALKCSVALRTY